jgi:hypothetical protein
MACSSMSIFIVSKNHSNFMALSAENETDSEKIRHNSEGE